MIVILYTGIILLTYYFAQIPECSSDQETINLYQVCFFIGSERNTYILNKEDNIEIIQYVVQLENSWNPLGREEEGTE